MKTIKWSKRAAVITLVITAMLIGQIGAAPRTQAATTSELQAQIQELLNKIAVLQAQIGATQPAVKSCPVLPQPLTVGSRGQAVTDLQTYLTSTGHFTFAGGPTGYFGPVTQSAVAAWQAANGVSPAVGYWGPISLAKYNAVCKSSPTPAPGDDDDDKSPVKGEEGVITVTRGSANSSSLDLGEKEDIYSIKVEVEESDVTLNRVDFIFSKRPWLYINKLVLTSGGENIASLNLSSSNVTEISADKWRVRFNNIDLKINEGEKPEIVLWATTPKSLAGNRINDTLSVYVPKDGIRAVDTAKLIQTEPSGDLSPRSFGFDENFGLGDIEATKNDDSPKTGIVVVSQTKKTSGVSVMFFDVEADDGAVTIEEIYVTATTSTPGKPDDVVSQLCLYQGSTKLDCGTFSLASSAITNRGVATGVVSGEYYVVFDDLNLEIDKDKEITLTLKADFNKTGSGTYSAGETITFALEQVAGTNQDFENTSDSVLGIGSDETFTLLLKGIGVESGSTSVELSPSKFAGDEAKGTYVIKFKVSAVEEDAWIHKNLGTSATSGVKFNITGSSYTGTTTANLTCSGCSTSGSIFFKVAKGTSRDFTMTVVLNPTTNGFYAVELDSVFFGGLAGLSPVHVEVSVPNTSVFETDPMFITG